MLLPNMKTNLNYLSDVIEFGAHLSSLETFKHKLVRKRSIVKDIFDVIRDLKLDGQQRLIWLGFLQICANLCTDNRKDILRSHSKKIGFEEEMN